MVSSAAADTRAAGTRLDDLLLQSPADRPENPRRSYEDPFESPYLDLYHYALDYLVNEFRILKSDFSDQANPLRNTIAINFTQHVKNMIDSQQKFRGLELRLDGDPKQVRPLSCDMGCLTLDEQGLDIYAVHLKEFAQRAIDSAIDSAIESVIESVVVSTVMSALSNGELRLCC